MHTSPSCSMCSSTQPPVGTATSSGEHFKLADVRESGRLYTRLRLGFTDQVLEGGGSVVVSWWSRAAPFFLTSTASTKKRSGRLLASAVVQSRLHFRPHFVADSTNILRGQLRLRHCRQPRLDGVDGYMAILRDDALEHRPRQKTTARPTR